MLFHPLAQQLSARERKGVCRRYGPGKLHGYENRHGGWGFVSLGSIWSVGGGRGNSNAVSLRGGVSVGYSRIYNRSHIQDEVYRYPALEWRHKNVLFVSPEIEGMMTAGDFSLRTGGAPIKLSSML